MWDEHEDCSTEAGARGRPSGFGNTQIMNQRPSFMSSMDYTSVFHEKNHNLPSFSPETQDRNVPNHEEVKRVSQVGPKKNI